MNIQIKKKSIYPVLSQIQGILEKRSTLPVFMNILLETKEKNKVWLYASDSELSFSDSLEGKVKEKGAIAVDGKKMFEIVRELTEGEFELKTEENYKVLIRQNKSVFKIHGLNPDDFPKFPPFKRKESHKISAERFLEVIDKTLYCVSLDESRYHLTGVFLERMDSKYRFVATDGHRLSFIEIEGSGKEGQDLGIIIPKKGLIEIKKMLSSAESGETIEIGIEKPRILIQFKTQSLNIRLIEGQYPDYKKLLPKTKGVEAFISRSAFMSSLKRISVLTSARFKGVNFTFKSNSLSIDFSHPDIGEACEDLPCLYKGKTMKIRFNSKYVLDVLHSIYEDELKISLGSELSAGLIQPKGRDNYTCLIMPMQQ